MSHRLTQGDTETHAHSPEPSHPYIKSHESNDEISFSFLSLCFTYSGYNFHLWTPWGPHAAAGHRRLLWEETLYHNEVAQSSDRISGLNTVKGFQSLVLTQSGELWWELWRSDTEPHHLYRLWAHFALSWNAHTLTLSPFFIHLYIYFIVTSFFPKSRPSDHTPPPFQLHKNLHRKWSMAQTVTMFPT